MPMPVKDIAGQTFGRLSVLGRAPSPNGARRAYWLCQCTCGAKAIARGSHLRSGNVVSCGCFRDEASSLRNRKPDDEITYNGAHDRIRRARGHASEYICVDCCAQADEWSLRTDAPVIRVGKNSNGFMRRFSVDPLDYEPRCVQCHRAYDRE